MQLILVLCLKFLLLFFSLTTLITTWLLLLNPHIMHFFVDTFIKSAFLNNLRSFTNKCTHLLKTSNFGPQGPQNAALQQRYSPCQSEKPNFSGEIEKTFCKNPNFGSKKFSWVVWSITNWSYTFSKWISWQISSNWLFQRNVDYDLKRAQTSEHCYKS